MKTVYIADDGMPFKTAEECRAHEEEVNKIKSYRVTLYLMGTYEAIVQAKSREEAIIEAEREMECEDISWETDPNMTPDVDPA